MIIIYTAFILWVANQFALRKINFLPCNACTGFTRLVYYNASNQFTKFTHRSFSKGGQP